MTRILLLGRTGQLGWQLDQILPSIGRVTAFDRTSLDLADPERLQEQVRTVSPDIIVNAAAYTDVDAAEREPERAHRVNAEAPGVLAMEADRLGALLVHYSTDYVFDGEKTVPYAEADAPNPINEYGRSKLAGERAIQEVGGGHLILRTSWVYSTRRESFVTKVLDWARTQREVRIVTDQIGNPTWCRALAEATAELLEQQPDQLAELSGVYHAAAGGAVSRFELAEAVLANAPRSARFLCETVQPVASEEFPRPAPRPKYTALDSSRLANTFGIRLPPWRTSLQRALASETSGASR